MQQVSELIHSLSDMCLILIFHWKSLLEELQRFRSAKSSEMKAAAGCPPSLVLFLIKQRAPLTRRLAFLNRASVDRKEKHVYGPLNCSIKRPRGMWPYWEHLGTATIFKWLKYRWFAAVDAVYYVDHDHVSDVTRIQTISSNKLCIFCRHPLSQQAVLTNTDWHKVPKLSRTKDWPRPPESVNNSSVEQTRQSIAPVRFITHLAQRLRLLSTKPTTIRQLNRF